MNVVVHLFSTVRTNCDDVTVMSRRTELAHSVAKKIPSFWIPVMQPSWFERKGCSTRTQSPGVFVFMCVGVWWTERERKIVCQKGDNQQQVDYCWE